MEFHNHFESINYNQMLSTRIAQIVFIGNRVVFVSVDAGMTGQLVRMEVINKLRIKYKGNYNL